MLGIEAEIDNALGPVRQPAAVTAAALALTLVAGLLFLRITRDFPPPPRWPRNLLLGLLGLSVFLASDLAIIDALVVPLVVPKRQRSKWFAAVLGVMTVSVAFYLWTHLAAASLPARITWREVALAVGVGYLETVGWCLLAFFAA